MMQSEVHGNRLSMLGFGAMRLPTREDGSIDQEQVQAMVDYAMENGVNYFDTAYPYHGGYSEISLREALAKYPRESYFLADKYPGHQIASTYNPAEVFEDQLKKCGVEYFDYYLLHNVCENSLDTYLDEKWGIIPYFIEQRKAGRIRRLGFSSHGGVEMLEGFLAKYGKDMEFCQLQLNYVDWTLQQGKEKCDLMEHYGIPVWVMEPLRGGKLANLPEEAAREMQALRPDESQAAWALRWLQKVPQVKLILSGMSNMAQMQDNVKTFQAEKPLSDAEKACLNKLAEGLKKSVPCTACRYCVEGCPMGLDIPGLIRAANDYTYQPSFNVSMMVDALPEGKRPADCIRCGACAAICPQKIDIPGVLHSFAEHMTQFPSWAEICRQREEAAKAMKK
ncbi:MAG: aldo/keto reductase [Clostridia bacterium]|nr:aldo/keto reductase [Clostridia bacterium]